MPKRRHYTITKEAQFNGFDIYSSRRKASKGHYVEILDGLFRGVEELFTHTSRINVIRFDLSFKNGDDYVEIEESINVLVSRFFKTLKRRLKAWKYEDGVNKGKNRGMDKVFHVFTRERSREKKAHLHCAIAFKSISKYSSPISRKNEYGENEYQWIYKMIDDAWRETCEVGHVNFGSRVNGKQVNHFYCIDRTNIDEQAKLMKGLSYLSKVNTKEDLPKDTRMFTFSRSIGRGSKDFRLTRDHHEGNQEEAA